MRASDFATEDGWLDARYERLRDRLDDARQDAAYDDFDRRAVTCGACEERYDPRVHRAIRLEPAWAEVDCCPACGSSEIAEDAGREPSVSPEMDAMIRKAFEERDR